MGGQHQKSPIPHGTHRAGMPTALRTTRAEFCRRQSGAVRASSTLPTPCRTPNNAGSTVVRTTALNLWSIPAVGGILPGQRVSPEHASLVERAVVYRLGLRLLTRHQVNRRSCGVEGHPQSTCRAVTRSSFRRRTARRPAVDAGSRSRWPAVCRPRRWGRRRYRVERSRRSGRGPRRRG
jgi:hypothetical protein